MVCTLTSEQIEPLRFVEVALLPLDDREDVDRVPSTRFIGRLFSNGARSFGTIDGCFVVGVVHVRPRDEPQQLRRLGRRGRGPVV
jgi:hypothetical protein